MNYPLLFLSLFSPLLSAMEIEKQYWAFPKQAIERIAMQIVKDTDATSVRWQIRSLTLINKTWHRVINSPQVFKKIIDLTAESKSNVAYTTVRFAHRWGNMPVFKHPEFQEWLAQEKERLKWEEQFLSTAESGGQIAPFLEQCKEDKKRFNINAVNKHGETALYLSSAKYLKNVTALLQAEADINKVRKDGVSPLQRAVRYNNIEIVQFLLSNGAKPNISDSEQFTPLIVAAHDGYSTIVQKLIEAKADLNLQTKDGWTALMWAADGNWSVIVQELIKHGARLDLKNDKGETALDKARMWCKENHEYYKTKKILKNSESKVQNN